MTSHARYYLDLSQPIRPNKRKSERDPDYIGSPRRIRGHNGSTHCVSEREQRELELQATELIHGVDRNGASRLHRDEKCNRIGFGGASLRHSSRDRNSEGAPPVPRAVTLREFAARIDSIRLDSVSLAESIACHLNSLADGFGSKLLDCDSVEIAAKLAGLSKSKAYRILESVRESWENSVYSVR